MGRTRYLLDSNTIIDYIAQLHPKEALQWLNQAIDEEINASVITKMKYYHMARTKTMIIRC